MPPADAEISAHIAAVTSVRDVYLPTDGWQTLGDNVQRDYIDAVVGVLQPDGPREVVIVHTSLHGVGNDTMMRAFRQGGFTEVNPVLSQADPDPDFPTVSFPNPEEPGAMDAALDLAEQTEPDIVIANDPDADRCAAAIAGPGGWRMLRGDEVGTLLGAYLLGLSGCPRAEHLTGTDVVFANSIVSSRQLAALCQSVGVRHEETLTGFKWIARVPGLGFGYEEALGYCVDPATVRDKDGISAALLLAELTAGLKAQGRSISDLLDELATAHGVYATDAYSVRVTDLALIAEIMTRLRSTPITEVAGVAVTRTDDLAQGDGGLPPTEGLRYYLADDSRIIVRPSGTEPKLKVYLEVIEPVAESDPANLKEARSRAAERLRLSGHRILRAAQPRIRAARTTPTPRASTSTAPRFQRCCTAPSRGPVAAVSRLSSAWSRNAVFPNSLSRSSRSAISTDSASTFTLGTRSGPPRDASRKPAPPTPSRLSRARKKLP